MVSGRNVTSLGEYLPIGLIFIALGNFFRKSGPDFWVNHFGVS